MAEDEYICETCGATFPNEKQLRHHVQGAHAGEEGVVEV